MTQARSITTVNRTGARGAGTFLARPGLAAHVLPCLLVLLSGCLGNPLRIFHRTETSSEDLVLKDGKLQPDHAHEHTTKEMEEARDLFRNGEYSRAQSLFSTIAEDKRNGKRLCEEARYYQAESYRLQLDYRNAAPTYVRLLKDHPAGAHHAQSIQRIFEIANYWLDDTRDRMEAKNKEKESQWSWPTMPVDFHIDRTKPVYDIEGHAVELLEAVYLNDPAGPLAERALFYLGSVKFFREDYRNADYYFNQIVKTYPNSALSPKALELSIICKQVSMGGPEYDGRRVAEAREMVHLASHAYPEVAREKGEFLRRQLYTISDQQARKDMLIAEFYQRTGHPGSAYFYYEVVRRRYQGTKYAEEAAARMEQLKKHGTAGGGFNLWPFGGSAPKDPEQKAEPPAQTAQQQPGDKQERQQRPERSPEQRGGGWWWGRGKEEAPAPVPQPSAAKQERGWWWSRQEAPQKPATQSNQYPGMEGLPGPQRYIPGQPLMSTLPRTPEPAPAPRLAPPPGNWPR